MTDGADSGTPERSAAQAAGGDRPDRLAGERLGIDPFGAARDEGGYEVPREAEPPREPMGLFARISAVVFAPGSLGEELRERPRWGRAMLLVAAMAAITVSLVPLDAISPSLTAAGGPGASAELPFSQETFMLLIRVATLVATPLMFVLMTVLLSGVSALVFIGILGDEGRFKQHLAAAAHAGFIGAIGGLVSVVPIRLAMDARAAITLATFFEPLLGDGYPLRVLAQLAPFSLWGLIAMGIVVSRYDPERSAISAIIWLVALRLVVALGFGFIPTPA